MFLHEEKWPQKKSCILFDINKVVTKKKKKKKEKINGQENTPILLVYTVVCVGACCIELDISDKY